MFDKISEFLSHKKNNSDYKQSKRSPFVIVLCVLIIIIPTVLAFFYAYFYEDSSFLSSNKVEVSLYDADGRLLSSQRVTEANISDSPLVEIFYNMNVTKIPATDVELSSSPNFKVYINQNDASLQYNCYFDENGAQCYLEDKNGVIYSVPEAQYNAFLNSEFSEPVYRSALPPVLTTGNGEAVSPILGEWHYRRQDGTLHSSTSLQTAPIGNTYKMGGAIDLSFDHHPEKCEIKIQDSTGADIYNGALDKLSFLTVDTGAVLNVKITAQWEENPEADFYGTLAYDFMAEITHRSDFSLSSTEIYPGQFILMTVTNVDDTAEILFSSKTRTAYEADVTLDNAITQLYEFTPVFVKDGSLARAILPFPRDLSEGVFTFSLSHGAAEQVFSVNILSAPEEKSYEIDKDSSLLSSIISDSSITSFAAIMKGISPPSGNTVLFRKEFLLPSALGLSSGYSFGDKVTSKDGYASFIAQGNEYSSNTSGGEAVYALNSGTVVATGSCDYLGSYVVLDHGLGLRTWYCHLSSIDVDKGDILAKGEQLGKCGTGGLLSSRGVLILCSVYDTLIDPSFILGKEIKY